MITEKPKYDSLAKHLVIYVAAHKASNVKKKTKSAQWLDKHFATWRNEFDHEDGFNLVIMNFSSEYLNSLIAFA